MDRTQYENPLISRYASDTMSAVWSPQRKVETWRQLWIVLAESQQELGLPITDEQLREMRAHQKNIDWDTAREYERRLRHDVMAHVHTFGDACPAAAPIIHWGATSCYVTDNTDLMLLKEALLLIRDRIVAVIDRLGSFAQSNRDLACLGFTHLQPAQPTTIGKRACLWAYDLVLDLDELEHRLARMAARSIKGTTGTQASFLELFRGDHDKVELLHAKIAEKMGFDRCYSVTGQTYSRKIDSQIIDMLCGIAQSVCKAGNDLRILAHRKELEEPFEDDQIGSSAMAYKRNPMRSERMCSLARFVLSLQSGASSTMSNQWMERTLDDSAIRRLMLPQSFLATDAILMLYENISSGLVVYPQVIAQNVASELPFMATENILMAAVAQGGNRQQLHEVIRQNSLAAARAVKQEGKPNDLLERLAADPAFAGVDWQQITNADQFVGRAPQQVDSFVKNHIDPIRDRYPDALQVSGSIDV